ncbi:MAG: hypothetical protein ACK4NN_09120 [Rheinheimera sp.]
MSKLDRRNFLKISACSLVGITMGGVSLRAVAEEQLKLDDPLAVEATMAELWRLNLPH